ncbi:MAG: cellulase family glycosylhydrolase [Anaerolineae bacterium]
MDYQQVADMGMNVIRFNLSYAIFEDDDSPYVYKQEGWHWLDQNIEWARKHGVYLIIDMHVPQGGYQGGGDEGFPLWDDVENQNRLKALWRAIAERYKDESIIAAWDLINEPTPSESQAQWETLAQVLIDEIRTVDQNHLVIVESTCCEGDPSLFLVEDENVMYDFHFYGPDEYTHQYNYYTGQGDGGAYPDPAVAVFPLDMEWAGAVENPTVPAGDSDWTYYEGVLYPVTDPRIIAGTPAFDCGANQGTVYFDDFVINEYDENRNLVRRIISVDVEYAEDASDLSDGIDPFISATSWWDFWSEDGSGSYAVSQTAHRGSTSLSVTPGAGATSLSNGGLAFGVKQGYRYAVSGWMKGAGVGEANCQLTIEFGKMPAGQEIMPRDRDSLESRLLPGVEFGRANNVPINVGEFGLMKWCFENNRGGLTWVRDMLELFDQYGVHFQYWDYHSDDFGLYRNTEGLPDPASANQEIIDLFAEFAMPDPVSGLTYYLGQTGCSDTGPGDDQTPFCSFETAVSRLRPGDTLIIKAGIYTDRLVVSGLAGTTGAPITIRGESRDAVIFDGGCPSFPCSINDTPNWDRNWDGMVNVTGGNYLTISDLAVRNDIGYGIVVNGGTGTIIKNTLIDGTGNGGLIVQEDPVNVAVVGNEVRNTNLGWRDESGAFRGGDHEAISIIRASEFVVANNYVHDVLEEGIDVKESSTDGAVHHNFVERTCAVGIYINEAHDVQVYRNQVRRSGSIRTDDGQEALCASHPVYGQFFGEYYGDGILLAVGDLGDLSQGRLSNIHVFQNVVSDCHLNGLQFWDQLKESGIGSGTMTGNRVYNNVFYNCGDAGIGSGVRLDEADNTVVTNNIIALNDEEGITGNAIGNSTISHNLFLFKHDWHQPVGADYVIGDPLFVDPANGDFHLQEDSPAIDNGLDVGLPYAGSAPDIGAYEYGLPSTDVCTSDANANGRVDVVDMMTTAQTPACLAYLPLLARSWRQPCSP